MSSPSTRGSIRVNSTTSAFRSSTLGASTCLRLKASSWRVSTAARVAGLLDLLHLAARRRRQVLAEEQLAVAEDDGEQVVEVVGHAAGQPSDRLHLLGLAELLLGVVPLLHLRAELGVAALDLGQHLVEGGGEDAELVAAGAGHAHRVVLALGDGARRSARRRMGSETRRCHRAEMIEAAPVLATMTMRTTTR